VEEIAEKAVGLSPEVFSVDQWAPQAALFLLAVGSLVM
jgi:hypothetical protein